MKIQLLFLILIVCSPVSMCDAMQQYNSFKQPPDNADAAVHDAYEQMVYQATQDLTRLGVTSCNVYSYGIASCGLVEKKYGYNAFVNSMSRVDHVLLKTALQQRRYGSLRLVKDPVLPFSSECLDILLLLVEGPKFIRAVLERPGYRPNKKILACAIEKAADIPAMHAVFAQYKPSANGGHRLFGDEAYESAIWDVIDDYGNPKTSKTLLARMPLHECKLIKLLHDEDAKAACKLLLDKQLVFSNVCLDAAVLLGVRSKMCTFVQKLLDVHMDDLYPRIIILARALAAAIDSDDAIYKLFLPQEQSLSACDETDDEKQSLLHAKRNHKRKPGDEKHYGFCILQ